MEKITLEKYGIKSETIRIQSPYRKEGWRDRLDYLLTEIELMEAGIQRKN